jgi:hypothetical protein
MGMSVFSFASPIRHLSPRAGFVEESAQHAADSGDPVGLTVGGFFRAPFERAPGDVDILPLQ